MWGRKLPVGSGVPPHDLVACGHWCPFLFPCRVPLAFVPFVGLAVAVAAAASAVAAATAAAAAVALPLLLLLLLLLLQCFEPPALSADLEVPIFDNGLVTYLGMFFPGLARRVPGGCSVSPAVSPPLAVLCFLFFSAGVPAHGVALARGVLPNCFAVLFCAGVLPNCFAGMLTGAL